MTIVDQGYAAYAVRREGLSGEVDDIVTYIIVTCNENTSVASTEHAIYRRGLQ